MNWSRARLKEMAKIALRGSYWKSVLVSLIALFAGGEIGSRAASSISTAAQSQDYGGYGNIMNSLVSDFGITIILMILSIILFAGIISIALRIFLLAPLEVGCRNFFRENLFQPVGMDRLKAGFTPNYWNTVKIQFLRGLFTTLWSLLFIIPGIVKSYEYMMIPYLLAEHPNMSTEEAFARSRQMMEGEKWEAFVLDLSFIGWDLLSVFTLGILEIFYVNPYRDLTHAALYGALKQKVAMQEQNRPYGEQGW